MNNLPNPEKTTWTIDEVISLAKSSWQRGEFQKVEAICNDLLRQAQGQEANVFWVVGLISYEIAQPNMAIKYLSESLHREATPEKYRILATVYFDFKQFESAFSCLRNALELQPTVEEGEKIFLLLLNCREYVQDFLTWRELGLFYLKAQHHSHYKAFYCFRKSLDIQPDSTEVYSLLVEAAKGNGEFYAQFSNQPVDKEDTQGLAALYFTALLGTPQHPTVAYHPQEPSWAELGGIYFYLQQYEMASHFLRKAITVNPQSVEIFTKLLSCEEQLNDFDNGDAEVVNEHHRNTLVIGHVPKRIIFIVGCPRSGTTLLNGLLAGGESYPMIPECTLLTSVLSLYQDILKYSDSSRFEVYVGAPANLKKIFKPTIQNLVTQLVNNITKDGMVPRSCLVLKDPLLTLKVDVLVDFFDDFKVVCVVRDPRDVIASMLKVNERKNSRIIFEDLVAEIFNYYYVLHNSELAKNSDLLHVVKYEDIVAQKQLSLDNLQKFVGFQIQSQPYSDRVMFEFDRNDATFSKNYGKPITSTTVGNYKKQIDQREESYIKNVFSGFDVVYQWW